MIIVVVVLGTRRVVPRALAAVSTRTNDEEFLLAILAIAIGIAFLVTLFGLSASLGAFIAGLVVSSGPHRSRATRYVEPFQVVFAAVFFASIGMLLDLQFLLDNLGSVAVLVVVIVGLKVVTTGAAARAFGQPWPVVGASALLLAQLGRVRLRPGTIRAGGGADSVRGGGDGLADLHRRKRGPVRPHPGAVCRR